MKPISNKQYFKEQFENRIQDSLLNKGLNFIFMTDNLSKLKIQLFGNSFYPIEPIMKLLLNSIEEKIKLVS